MDYIEFNVAFVIMIIWLSMDYSNGFLVNNMINNNNKYKLSEPFNYQNDYEYALNDQFSFWNDVAKKYVHWDKEFDNIYIGSLSNGEWFKGGLLNTCYNALDKHIISGRGNEIAFVHEIPLKHVTHQITYQELYNKVCRLSRSLKNLGIKKGDVVVLYMHNSIEIIISLLACSRIGAIHNIIFGGYYSTALNEMINVCGAPKLIITSSFGFLYDSIFNYSQVIFESLSNSNIKINNIIVFNRKDINNNFSIENQLNNIGDKINSNINILDWDELIKDVVEPLIDYELVESNHPVYIINTSGTTNKPKAIVRETAGHIASLCYAFKNIYQLKQGDTYLSSASIGWISGHSLLVYGCLFSGVKAILLEGSLKDQVRDFWHLVEKHKANVISITPSQVNLLKRLDPNGEIRFQFNLSNLKHSSIGSEKVHETIVNYLNITLKIPSIIEFWQTETGYPMIYNNNTCSNCGIINDSIGKVVPGYNIKIISKLSDGSVIENEPNQEGEIAVKLPLPPGIVNSLFNDNQKKELYNQHYLNEYKGYFRTKDIGCCSENGLIYYCSRSDDSISIMGDQISAGLLEDQILKHQSISECCVIGINDEIGQAPTCLAVLQNQNQIKSIDDIELLKYEINQIIKENFCICTEIKHLVIVKRLPRTRSGKRIKSILSSIFNNQSYSIPPTIQDVKVIEELLEQYEIFKSINNKSQK